MTSFLEGIQKLAQQFTVAGGSLSDVPQGPPPAWSGYASMGTMGIPMTPWGKSVLNFQRTTAASPNVLTRFAGRGAAQALFTAPLLAINELAFRGIAPLGIKGAKEQAVEAAGQFGNQLGRSNIFLGRAIARKFAPAAPAPTSTSTTTPARTTTTQRGRGVPVRTYRA